MCQFKYVANGFLLLLGERFPFVRLEDSRQISIERVCKHWHFYRWPNSVVFTIRLHFRRFFLRLFLANVRRNEMKTFITMNRIWNFWDCLGDHFVSTIKFIKTHKNWLFFWENSSYASYWSNIFAIITILFVGAQKKSRNHFSIFCALRNEFPILQWPINTSLHFKCNHITRGVYKITIWWVMYFIWLEIVFGRKENLLFSWKHNFQ